MSAWDKDGAGERLSTEVAGALASALPAAGPRAERASALRERVLARVRRDAERAPREPKTVRAVEGEWVELQPGLFEKVLYLDLETGTRSFLVRADAGSSVPAHVHDGAEECLVLEGDLQIGDLDLRAGDYHVAPRSTTHPVLTTHGGCVVFLREPMRARDHA